MIHYKNLSQAEMVLEALGSPVRREMLNYILSESGITLGKLAQKVHLTGGAVTAHIKLLEGSGLIRIEREDGVRGVCKRCYCAIDKMLFDLNTDFFTPNKYEFNVPIGRYTEAVIDPYCAIATKNGYIGERDDPRYFTYVEREQASLLYFRSGKLVYALPNPLKRGQVAKSISVSFEMSSKPTGYGRLGDSEVNFFLCQKNVGKHIIDGEFTDRRGYFNPDWYANNYGQYGRLKTLTCNELGTFIDGVKISSVSISDLNIDNPSFAFSTSTGVTLFGEGFGDYDVALNYVVEHE